MNTPEPFASLAFSFVSQAPLDMCELNRTRLKTGEADRSALGCADCGASLNSSMSRSVGIEHVRVSVCRLCELFFNALLSEAEWQQSKIMV